MLAEALSPKILFVLAWRKLPACAERPLTVFNPLSNQLPIIPSFPRAPNKWGYGGMRYQGNQREFPGKGSSSPEERIEASASLPFLKEDGNYILSEVLKQAAKFVAVRDEAAMKAFWDERTRWMPEIAESLRPELSSIRTKLGPKGARSSAKLHIPLLATFLEMREMGGQACLGQFVTGFSAIGESAGQGVCPTAESNEEMTPRDELFEAAKS